MTAMTKAHELLREITRAALNLAAGKPVRDFDEQVARVNAFLSQPEPQAMSAECQGKWSERPGGYAGATFYCDEHPNIKDGRYCPGRCQMSAEEVREMCVQVCAEVAIEHRDGRKMPSVHTARWSELIANVCIERIRSLDLSRKEKS